MTATAVIEAAPYRPTTAYEIVGRYTGQHLTTFFDRENAEDFIRRFQLDAWTVREVVY